MAFVHHTMLTAENLRGLPSKQLHTNVEPHYSPRSRAAPLCGVGGLVGVYSRLILCLFLTCVPLFFSWRKKRITRISLFANMSS